MAPPSRLPGRSSEEPSGGRVARWERDVLAARGGPQRVTPVPRGRITGPEDEASEWRRVFEEFVTTKQQCGENVDGFTYQKFEQTLKKNRDALIQRHGCKRVKFSVYVKDGKAALKASPIKE